MSLVPDGGIDVWQELRLKFNDGLIQINSVPGRAPQEGGAGEGTRL